MQVTRDPMGGKGPRLTMEVGIPGRYVVYLPGGKGAGRVAAAGRRRSGSGCGRYAAR